MIKPRAEMITKWKERRYLGKDDPLEFDESLAAMMARRDEMVIEEILALIVSHPTIKVPAGIADELRALKGKLR